MGREDVAKAILAMEDEDVRAQLAGGDFSAIPDAELSDDEQALVAAGADDFPEVAGFAFDKFATGWKVEEGEAWKIEEGSWKVDVTSPFGQMVTYPQKVI